MALEIVILPMVVAVAIYALHRYHLTGEKLDLLYAAAMLPWAALIALSLLADPIWLAAGGRHATLLIHQFTIVGLLAFLLESIHAFGRRERLLLTVQAALGVAAALIPLLAPDDLAKVWRFGGWNYGWIELNAIFAMAILIRMTILIWRSGSPEGWMVLLVTVVGIGFIVGDVRSAATGVAKPSSSDYFFSISLFLLWLILTGRVGALKWRAEKQIIQKAPKHLAQDLHDGVGSQLTAIIAGLEIATPQQRATVMALQHCLLELKLLVDGEGGDQGLTELLASLRYRLQPLLHSAGIAMKWEMSDARELELVRGNAARQVLRVAQEALANVVRHSEAREVVVNCDYEASEDAVILRIQDDGVGIPRGIDLSEACATSSSGEQRGKGITGMAWRARSLGAELTIEAAPGKGTLVCLRLPAGLLTEADR